MNRNNTIRAVTESLKQLTTKMKDDQNERSEYEVLSKMLMRMGGNELSHHDGEGGATPLVMNQQQLRQQLHEVAIHNNPTQQSMIIKQEQLSPSDEEGFLQQASDSRSIIMNNNNNHSHPETTFATSNNHEESEESIESTTCDTTSIKKERKIKKKKKQVANDTCTNNDDTEQVFKNQPVVVEIDGGCSKNRTILAGYVNHKYEIGKLISFKKVSSKKVFSFYHIPLSHLATMINTCVSAM